ncbi:MAG: porin [Akkermansiaceae bacterium]
MKKTHPNLWYISAVFTILTAHFAIAEPGTRVTTSVATQNNGDWCNWLKNKPGLLYDNKDNPYVQKFQLAGRLHWQYAYVDGSADTPGGTQNFHYDTEEIRRLRLESKLAFLHYFMLGVSIDLEDDIAPQGLEGDHDVQYADIYSATLSFDAAKAFDISALDGFKISIGKHKVSSTAEFALSSKKIKTVERSAISNFTSPPSSTGLVVAVEKGRWVFELGAFSGDTEPEFSEFDSANDYFFTLHVGRELENSVYFDQARIDLRMIVNGDDTKNATSNPSSPGSYNLDWVASLGFQAKKGRIALLTDLVYGENGDDFNTTGAERPNREGSFWSIVLLPSYWVIEDRLEAVFRYQYANSSRPEGIRMNSRYARRAGGVKSIPSLEGGRGDEHHSTYLGLNYYLCGDNTKVMIGVEYDDLDSDGVDIYQGYTAWAAFRFYF